MKRLTILWLVCFAPSSLTAAAQEHTVTFTGEAVEGQTFRKSIGQGHDFVLEPQPQGDTGWSLQVVLEGTPSNLDCGDFVWGATPPYR
jgi:hypothetical protein